MFKLTQTQPTARDRHLRLEGWLTSDFLPELRRLTEPDHVRPTLDLAGLTSLDDASRAYLLDLKRRGCRMLGGSLYINQLLEEGHAVNTLLAPVTPPASQLPPTTPPNPPTTDSVERDLVARLRAGEESAFADLINLYGGRSLAVSRRFMKTEQDAEDAVQEAFLSAFKNLGTFDGKSKLGTWLHRIVVNACLMKLRSQRRRPETSIENLLPTFLDDGHQSRPNRPWPQGGSPALSLETRELQQLVREKIDQLPESYRNVLLLRDIEGLDTQETAAALGDGMTETAVKTRLHRARQALRELLDQHFKGQEP